MDEECWASGLGLRVWGSGFMARLWDRLWGLRIKDAGLGVLGLEIGQLDAEAAWLRILGLWLGKEQFSHSGVRLRASGRRVAVEVSGLRPS